MIHFIVMAQVGLNVKHNNCIQSTLRLVARGCVRARHVVTQLCFLTDFQR